MSDKLESRELRIIKDTPSRNKEGAGWKLRVVQYHKGGKSLSVKLESGEYFKGDDGIVRFKTKGLSDRDMEELEKKAAEAPELTVYQIVRRLQKNPPAIPQEQAAAATSDEEAPF